MTKLKEKNIAGWDIGGAHIKVALAANNDMQVFQWYCPLWKGVQELEKILDLALKEIGNQKFKHNVTMTGELVDCFTSKADGVQQIVSTFVKKMAKESDIKFFTKEQMLNDQQAIHSFEEIASANWLASGVTVARSCENALFVDMGSTTTDLLMIKDAQVKNIGHSDFERLRSGELIYTGIVRSCVNTLCASILYRDEKIPMMAEYFANTADVYRILGVLPKHADLGETCDGGEKDWTASIRRLARMIGVDVLTIQQDESKVWQSAAQHLAQQQKNMLAKQIQKFIAEHGCEKKIIGAGIGRFLIKELAQELTLEYIDFADLLLNGLMNCDEHAADCAPAVSLALR